MAGPRPLLFARALFHLRGYEPQPVTPVALWAWLQQFPSAERGILLRLILSIQVIRKHEAVRIALDKNQQILAALAEDGIGPERVIYTSLDETASSSHVMLNELRNHANLTRRKAKFCDSHSEFRMAKLTTHLGAGAIVYVDDFAGTGNQFSDNRNRLAAFIHGDFSEFLILPCVCEEALEKIEKLGVETRAGFVHKAEDRPLRSESHHFAPSERDRLLALAVMVDAKWPLGYRGLGTNIIFDRHAPNSTSPLLRGNVGQDRFRGVVPRWDDKPPKVEP